MSPSLHPALQPAGPRGKSIVVARSRVPGTIRVEVEEMAGRAVVLARTRSNRRRGALSPQDGHTLAEAAWLAVEKRLPLVLVLASSGADVTEGVQALHGWGLAARGVAACSGIVPVLTVVTGPAVSGPALLLGLADVVVMTGDAFAFVSGPDMVAEFTGVRIGLHQLGGVAVHARSTGICALEARNVDEALGLVEGILSYLPANCDLEPPEAPCDDPVDRLTPELRTIIPDKATSSYDVRHVAQAIADGGEITELRARWAPQLVTALARVDGRPVGIMANQPQALAGTLDIAASQKGARFVRFCDSFNLPIVTLVDTPGFLPGKDLEWRGMIRHGAELAYAYAEATVPRVCVILRKAYGGAYIVMDSRGLGNDICMAWPGAEVAVMGAEGAVQILHRRETPERQKELLDSYKEDYLTPWPAAERGFIDMVIDPAETRQSIGRALDLLCTRQEWLPERKHSNSPL